MWSLPFLLVFSVMLIHYINWTCAFKYVLAWILSYFSQSSKSLRCSMFCTPFLYSLKEVFTPTSLKNPAFINDLHFIYTIVRGEVWRTEEWNLWIQPYLGCSVMATSFGELWGAGILVDKIRWTITKKRVQLFLLAQSFLWTWNKSVDGGLCCRCTLRWLNTPPTSLASPPYCEVQCVHMHTKSVNSFIVHCNQIHIMLYKNV